MRYVKVVWEHDHADEPVLFLSELGEDDYETRKVQTYRDGRLEWADAEHESNAAFLTEVPFPSVEEISEQPECSAEAITAEEFERAWRRSAPDPEEHRRTGLPADERRPCSCGHLRSRE